MASVSSLDQDMRKLRMDRFTPQDADEVRAWIEDTLGESLPSGDLIDGLKDGVVLCKLANLVLPPPGIKFKASAMPFTQRENISHFLSACEMAPLNLPAHDRFLTVDLYDNKDPAQVVQCIGAFSRAANAAKPSRFPKVIGPKRTAISPTRKGPNGTALNDSSARARGYSNASQASDSAFSARSATTRTLSPAHTGGSGTDNSLKPGRTVSTWSKKSDESATAPAWNIHQYGYMGGASQGNQGISFGARRQITSTVPGVPSLAEKERRRREQEAEAEKARQEKEEAERTNRARKVTQEEDAKAAEERRWREETQKARDEQRREMEEQKRVWEEEERRWKETEEQRQREEQEAEESWRKQGYSGLRSAPQSHLTVADNETNRRVSEVDRIKELEKQLEEARERERQYQLERETRKQEPGVEHRSFKTESALPQNKAPQLVKSNDNIKSSSQVEEREALKREWTNQQSQTATSDRATPSVPPASAPQAPPPTPAPSTRAPTGNTDTPMQQKPAVLATSTPFSTPVDSSSPSTSRYSSALPAPSTRTDRYLAANPSVVAGTTPSSSPRFAREVSMSSTAERAEEDARRKASQARTSAGGLASKSLLEREMEQERERQREWEEAQMTRSTGSGTIPPPATRPLGPRELKR